MKLLEERLLNQLEKLQSEHRLRNLKLSEDLIDFCSNDYLGLAKNEGILKEINDVNISTLGSGGSRLLAGNYPEIEDLELLLSQVHNKGSALVFNSGYSANLGVFSSIPNKNSVILYDEKIHACIKDGMRLSMAKRFSFRHNDLADLQKKLKQHSESEIFVAIESIYSMDGDHAPIVEIVNILSSYNAYLIVDEAHSTGVFGAKGAGLVSQLGLDDEVFVKIHTFGKAIGSHGAVVLSDQWVKDYLINNSRPFIFTTSMPPHQTLVLSILYKYLSQNYLELQRNLNDKIHFFRSEVTRKISPSLSPIQVVVIPGNIEVRKAAEFLQTNGFDVRPVLSPTVPEGQERLRICLHSFNTHEQISQLAKLINQI